ncbi:hypothetical protein KBI52_05905 [Microvirga sp. HBU67558]|uniref:hypothetical protein n=1 Tax=Microvirga TaxID=186650 RepID=UPI001B359E6A|nr:MULTISPECIES: hypothetical protein [unclassified Microvirga]MBQ0819752.1 hypothetical protein [Microvirga sp. HBU67558]
MTDAKKKGSHAALLSLPIEWASRIFAVQYDDGVVISLPFLGVSSLNFGPLFSGLFS